MDILTTSRNAAVRPQSRPGAPGPAGGEDSREPSWQLILSFEHELRKKAYKLVLDRGATIVAALEQACTDTELKNIQFKPGPLHCSSKIA